MKICVVSDSHGNRDILNQIYNANPNCNIYLLLGDSELPEEYIYPFISVKGNCDYFLDYPIYRIIHTPSGNIYCEHGHIHGKGNISLLEKYNCKVYLYGHTHVHKLEQVKDYYFVNPGSVERPRDSSNGTYLIIDCNQETGFNFMFKEL